MGDVHVFHRSLALEAAVQQHAMHRVRIREVWAGRRNAGWRRFCIAAAHDGQVFRRHKLAAHRLHFIPRRAQDHRKSALG